MAVFEVSAFSLSGKHLPPLTGALLPFPLMGKAYHRDRGDTDLKRTATATGADPNPKLMKIIFATGALCTRGSSRKRSGNDPGAVILPEQQRPQA